MICCYQFFCPRLQRMWKRQGHEDCKSTSSFMLIETTKDKLYNGGQEVFHMAKVYPKGSKTEISPDNGYLENNSKLTKSKLNNPVHPITLPTRMDKGGPRTALFKLCRMLQWPMPEFESREEKFRPPITINGLKTPNFNLFMTKLPLHIPNSKVLTHGRAKNRQEKCTRFNSTCAAP
ncbi:hypothetical protein MUK42_19700 [Musa troglodytarum]|uniref:Uncharacterized protein n=1 Tax=Musa troglodytarum TaxID=320322 RepID=A0A9E7K4J5_9LILI|nr:hypothetical protein MUK42_19700 [Musa troglodytarum]